MFNSLGVTEQTLLPIPGFIKEDPKLPEDKILPPPSPRPQNSIFDTDEEKSKVNRRVLVPAPTLICTDETTAPLYLGSFCCFRQSIFRTMTIFLLYDSQRILGCFARNFCVVKSELFYSKPSVCIKLCHGRVSPGLTEVLQSQRIPTGKQCVWAAAGGSDITQVRVWDRGHVSPGL